MLKVWNVIYPLLLYYAVLLIVFSLAGTIFGNDNEHYVLCQLIATVWTIPVMWPHYRMDQNLRGIGKRSIDWSAVAVTVLLLACLSISLNNILSMSPLVEMSAGFKEATEGFYSGPVWLEIVSSAIATPFLEELVFRGIVYGRIRASLSAGVSIVLSAVLFGIIHFNVVQFLYAFLLGLILSLLVEVYKEVYVAVIGHMAANLIAVIRTETGWLSFMVNGDAFAWGSSLVLLVLGMVVLGVWIYRMKKQKEDASS